MLRTISKWLLRLGVSVIGVRLGNAILNALDLKPELWILGHIMAVPTEAWLEVARWGLAFGIALLIWLAWHLVHVKRDVWAERDQLELSAIANLSVGKSVGTSIKTEPQLSRHRFLKDAVMSGALKTVNMRGSNPNVMTIVTREDLRAYAKTTNRADLLGVLAKWDKLNPPVLAQELESKSFVAVPIENKRPRSAERDTGMLEALAFLQSGHWGLAPTNLLATKDTDRQPMLKCLQDVRQAALDGDIRVWGRPSPESPLDLIPKEEWKIFKIKFLSLFHDNSQTQTEIAEIGVNSSLKYHDLMVSRFEVEKKWPV
jgi:hypothetical protein